MIVPTILRIGIIRALNVAHGERQLIISLLGDKCMQQNYFGCMFWNFHVI